MQRGILRCTLQGVFVVNKTMSLTALFAFLSSLSFIFKFYKQIQMEKVVFMEIQTIFSHLKSFET